MALGSDLKGTAKVVPLGLQSENLHKCLLHEKKKMVKWLKLTLSETWNLTKVLHGFEKCLFKKNCGTSVKIVDLVWSLHELYAPTPLNPPEFYKTLENHQLCSCESYKCSFEAAIEGVRIGFKVLTTSMPRTSPLFVFDLSHIFLEKLECSC